MSGEAESTIVVPHVEWDEVVEWLDGRWRPGEHMSIFAPTGRGKTFAIVHGLLPLWTRSRALIVDIKHDKGTLGETGHVVAEHPTAASIPFRVRKWTQGRDHESWDKDPEWYKLQPASYRMTADRTAMRARIEQQRQAVTRALDQCFREGDWLLIFDEVNDLSNPTPPDLDLGHVLTKIWKQGRDRNVTIIAGTQSPSYAPAAMYDQPTYVFFGRMHDVRRVERFGEIAGNPELVEQVVPQLQGHEFLIMDLPEETEVVSEVD